MEAPFNQAQADEMLAMPKRAQYEGQIWSIDSAPRVGFIAREFAALPEDNEFVQKADDFNNVAPDFEQDFGLQDDEVPDFEEEQQD